MVRDRSRSAMKEQIRTFCVQTRSAMEGPTSVVVTVAPGNEDVPKRSNISLMASFRLMA